MEFESIVANSQYLLAVEEGRGRSRKWREMLKFPLISACADLERTLEANGGAQRAGVRRAPAKRPVTRTRGRRTTAQS